MIDSCATEGGMERNGSNVSPAPDAFQYSHSHGDIRGARKKAPKGFFARLAAPQACLRRRAAKPIKPKPANIMA